MKDFKQKWNRRYMGLMMSLAGVDVLFIGFYALISGRFDVFWPALTLSVLFLCVLNGGIAFWMTRPLRRFQSDRHEDVQDFAQFLHDLPLKSAITIFFLTLVYTFTVFSQGIYVDATIQDLGISQEKALIAILWFGSIYAFQFALYAYFVALDYRGQVRQDYSRAGASLAYQRGMGVIGRLMVAMVVIVILPAALVLADVHYFYDIRQAQGLTIEQAIVLDISATVIAAFICLFFISRSIAKPLDAVMASFDALLTAPQSTTVAVMSDDELGRLSLRFNQLAQALSEKEKIRRTLYQFVNQELAENYMDHQQDNPVGKGELKTATLLFSDVTGFTAWSETIAPEQLMQALNEYYQLVSEIVKKHNGTVLNYIGDSIFAIFNIPNPDDQHALNAVRCALEIQQRVNGLSFAGDSHLPTRIGINTGPVVAGFVGTADHIEYSVYGDSVNTAARLEQLNKTLGSSVLMSQATARLISGDATLKGLMHTHENIQLRGKRSLMKVIELKRPLYNSSFVL